MDTVNDFCGFESARGCHLCSDCSDAVRGEIDSISSEKLECVEFVLTWQEEKELEYVPGHCWLDQENSGTTCDCCGTTEYGWRSHMLEVPEVDPFEDVDPLDMD